MSTIIKNQFPTKEGTLKIAIVGEAPGELEEAYGKPFIGPSGKLLTAMLIEAGVQRDTCFIGNVVQVRPTDNNISLFPPGSPEWQDGCRQLREDLMMFGPDVCLLLGATPLKAAGVSTSVSAYRGTLFECNTIESPFFGFKCIASYHPSYILRGNNREAVVLLADIKKAKSVNQGEEIQRPERRYEVDLTADEIVRRLKEIEELKPLVSFDIEGGIDGVTCCSVSTDPSNAWVIPFFSGQTNYWSVQDEGRIWAALSSMLKNPMVPKVLQNYLYDSFVLAWCHNILIANVQEDTMLKHWELFPEMEKGLGFQTSFYTQEPYYKDERTKPDARTHHIYCCKDSAVTLEICKKQEALLQAREGNAKEHYRFNMNMLRPMLFMELKGIRYDQDKALGKISNLKEELEIIAGRLKEFNNGVELNTSSPKQMLAFLRSRGHTPPINRKTGAATANYEALLSLAKKSKDPALLDCILMRGIRTRVQMLNIRSDGDGRIRCGYNVVGTDTGRVTCYTSPTGSGYNLQTIPEYDRDLFLADEGKYMFQCDLSGADAWTVAAWCAKLGDHTMLDDLRSGIKVAKVIAAMTREGSHIASFPRDLVAEYAAKITKEDPLYFGSKCVQHGSNYGMGKNLMSSLIFIQSEGKIGMTAAECAQMQALYFQRYPGIKRWHSFVQTRLAQGSKFVSASGHVRTFGGDRHGHETFKQALANEPQDNTTYATNYAALRLWQDPENRNPDGTLIIEPLHQVHDALIGQFPIEKAEWAVQKIRGYFNNTLRIADQEIIIPFEGNYGVSWGNLNIGKI